MSDAPRNAAELALDQRVVELSEIEQRLDHDADLEYIGDQLERWRVRTIQVIAERISPAEARRFSTHKTEISVFQAIVPIAVFNNLRENITRYRSLLLSLREEIQNPGYRFFPKGQTDQPSSGKAPSQPSSAMLATVSQEPVRSSAKSELLAPEKVTLVWLLHNVSVPGWVTVGTVLIAVFVGGATTGQTTFVRELLSKKSEDHTSQHAISSEDIKTKVDQLTQAHNASTAKIQAAIIEEEQRAAISSNYDHLKAADNLRQELRRENEAFLSKVGAIKSLEP